MTNLGIPTQRTWTDGEVVTAAMLNANVRDAVNFGINTPALIARQTAAQNINNQQWTPVTYDTVDVDPYGGHNASITSRYVAPLSGVYHVCGQCDFTSNANGFRSIRIQVNGGAQILAKLQISPVGGGVDTALSNLCGRVPQRRGLRRDRGLSILRRHHPHRRHRLTTPHDRHVGAHLTLKATTCQYRITRQPRRVSRRCSSFSVSWPGGYIDGSPALNTPVGVVEYRSQQLEPNGRSSLRDDVTASRRALDQHSGDLAALHKQVDAITAAQRGDLS